MWPCLHIGLTPGEIDLRVVRPRRPLGPKPPASVRLSAISNFSAVVANALTMVANFPVHHGELALRISIYLRPATGDAFDNSIFPLANLASRIPLEHVSSHQSEGQFIYFCQSGDEIALVQALKITLRAYRYPPVHTVFALNELCPGYMAFNWH